MYDDHCAAVGWRFKVLALGTWGGLGPEGAAILDTLITRAAAWQVGDLRTGQKEQYRQSVGLALMREIFALLERKNTVC